MLNFTLPKIESFLMTRTKRNPLPTLATILFDAFASPLDPSHPFNLPDDLKDTEKYQKMCQDIGNKLIKDFGLQEKWYFEPNTRSFWGNDKDEISHSICNISGELPIEDFNIAQALYDKGQEVTHFRVIGCYCNISDPLPSYPLPKPYVHVTPSDNEFISNDDNLTEYETVIDFFIPQNWDQKFRHYIIKNLSYSIATVTPLTYYYEFNNDPKISTTDERTIKSLLRAGYKVTKYHIVPCKEEVK